MDHAEIISWYKSAEPVTLFLLVNGQPRYDMLWLNPILFMVEPPKYTHLQPATPYFCWFEHLYPAYTHRRHINISTVSMVQNQLI